MEGSSPVRNSKNKKLNEGDDMDGNSCCLDSLPDPILRHILSFLPTKDAVGTSILSKRWQYMWTSIPNLDFLQEETDDRNLFMNFVERVLLLHDSSNVEKFSLMCDVLNDASRINAWISTAIRRNAQKIVIDLSNFEELFVLPHCLFTCDAVTVLKVQMSSILKLPPSISFSSLRKLTLRDVTFSDDNSMQQLLLGCPVLEVLCINNCNWEHLKAVCISAPKLRGLGIEEYEYDSDTDDVSSCQVMINGAGLESFHCEGELRNDYCLYNSSSVVDACIEVHSWCERPREVSYRVNKLLREVSNVNKLTLSGRAIELIDRAAELLVHLPIFNNLTYLKLQTGLVNFDFKALLNILQKSPHLTSLVFEEGIGKKDDCILDPVPPCFLHLKNIEVYGFNGSKKGLNVIKILLMNAAVLDRMYFYSCDREDQLEWREELNEQILMFPRASKSCSIVCSSSILPTLPI